MRYRRADTAGGTYFFKVNLVERSADLLVRHVDYSHYNTVKHGWISRAVEWPHTTLHSYIERGMARRIGAERQIKRCADMVSA